MISKGVAIKYGDVAPGAKENFEPAANEQESFVNLSDLTKYNLDFIKYANPCELYQTLLDGSTEAFPTVPESQNMGLWSTQISDADGYLNTPIVLTLSANLQQQYSSQGITLTFDTHNNIFANSLNIKWYRVTSEDITLLSDVDFTPTSAFYFCRNAVSNYNKIVITFNRINMPYNRFKLYAIDYGYGTYFYGDELRKVNLSQHFDPISSKIPINSVNFILDSNTDMEYSFQAKQPLSVYMNGLLKATTFVKKSTRNAKRLWDVSSEDYISLMDNIAYHGDLYGNAVAYDVLEDIFKTAKVPYVISESLRDVKIRGYIPYTTCRDALMQVLFATQYVCTTVNRDFVEVYQMQEDVPVQTIPLDRIMQGQKFTSSETVTDVELLSHSYRAIRTEVFLYDSYDDGEGNNIFLKFDRPLHSLELENGEIIEQSANHIIFNAFEACTLRGYEFEHTTKKHKKHNPLILANEIENIISIDDATLISKNNVEMVLNKCYDWLIKTDSTYAKIIEGKHVVDPLNAIYGDAIFGTVKYGEMIPAQVTYDEPTNVGDLITVETEYLGDVTGRIIKQTFNLNGGIIVKDTELK